MSCPTETEAKPEETEAVSEETEVDRKGYRFYWFMEEPNANDVIDPNILKLFTGGDVLFNMP
jgi:hypothetical protein